MTNELHRKTKLKMSPAMFILLGFASVILVGAFLLCLPISNTSGKWIPFIDALFTSTSSVCVTGLMVFDVAIELNLFGQFVVMLLIQIGGLGFVAITSLLFLLLGKKIDYATRLTIQQSLNKEDSQGVVKTVVFVLVATLVCEFVGFLVLAPSMIAFSGSFGSGIFKAMFLSISAFCNAGVSPLGSAVPEFSNMAFFADKCWVLIPLMLLSILGGVGFVVIIDLIAKTRKKKKLNLHTRVVLLMSTILISVGFVLILAFEWNNPETLGSMSFGNKVVNAMFQSVVTRSSGFATFNFASLNPITQILCGVWMLIGGSPASMAGGLKTTTVFVLLLFIFKSTDQNGNIIYKNKKIPYTIVSKAMKIFLIVISSVLVGSTLVFAFEGGKIGFGAAFFEALASISTVGLSLGVTSFLGVGSKLVLSLMMFMGRIGMLTIPLAFKIKNQTAGIEYPDAKITVG